MKSIISILVVLAVVIAALFMFGIFSQEEPAVETQVQDTQMEEGEPSAEDETQTTTETDFGTDIEMEFPIPDDAVTDQDDEGSAVSFSLEGHNFEFLRDGESAPVLRVKQGDTVTVTLRSTGGTHDFVIDEFDARTERVNAGQTTTVTFVASETGTFEYYCSVGSHRAMGMVGTFIVEE